ncbi:hypothetical protein, partial [Halolamina salina]
MKKVTLFTVGKVWYFMARNVTVPSIGVRIGEFVARHPRLVVAIAAAIPPAATRPTNHVGRFDSWAASTT